MHINIEKRCDASPNNSRDHNPPHKATCVSTRSPLSARHGRPISKRRIWQASRTKRSVSNIIGSVPNGKRRWGGGHRFIPLDHPHPPGPDAHRPRGQKNTRCVPQGPRASPQSLTNTNGFQRPCPRTLGARLCRLQHHRRVLRLVQHDHRRRPRRPDARMVIRMDDHRTAVRHPLAQRRLIPVSRRERRDPADA